MNTQSNNKFQVGSKWLNKKENKEYTIAKYIENTQWPIKLNTDWICSIEYFLENFTLIVTNEPKEDKCSWCYGSGIVVGTGEYTIDDCSGCKGTGLKQPVMRLGAKVQFRNGNRLAGVVDVIIWAPIRVTYDNGMTGWFSGSDVEVIG